MKIRLSCFDLDRGGSFSGELRRNAVRVSPCHCPVYI